MRDDSDLLRSYAETHSEAAFAELVRRHIDLVYFSALRRCGGDSHRAEDIAQQVFTELARRAAALGHHTSLVGWLYTTTRNLSAKALRAEQSRRAREQASHTMSDADSPSPAADWERLRPELDQVLDLLPERDRDAILLRFFGNRPFAEIGRALKVSDDAARMRTDRALEKLRALLERRGITSTAAALALALGASSSVAAPATLSGSVTTAALAEAAATGSAGAGLTASLAMTFAKVSGGTLAAALALVLSTSANAYLLLQSSEPQPSIAPKYTQAPSPTPPSIALRVFRDSDPVALRDQLRAAGIDDSTIRGLVEAILRRHYRETLSARRTEALRQGWWNDPSWSYQLALVSGVPRLVDDQPLLRQMVLDPLEQIFGPDPLDIAVREAKFGFLLGETRQAFVELERYYDAATARLSGDERNGPLGAKLRAERTAAEKRLFDALSPEAKEEHRLRLAMSGSAARMRMSQMDGSEQEYRTVMATITPLQGGESAQRWEAENQAFLKITEALGYDRAVDYIWAGSFEYPNIARAAREANLPVSTAGRVLQLAAETTQRAIDVHADSTRSPEQRRAALRALQQEVQPTLDAILPPAQQQKVGGDGLLWFTALSEGKYKRLSTTSGINNTMVISPSTFSVEKAPSGPLGRQFFVPRPTP